MEIVACTSRLPPVTKKAIPTSHGPFPATCLLAVPKLNVQCHSLNRLSKKAKTEGYRFICHVRVIESIV